MKVDEKFPANATGLNSKSLPSKILASKKKYCATGFKMNKEWVTLMASSNAAGNHKLPSMMIGKLKKPHAFKNVNMKSLIYT